jgi:CRP/FNR family cyclic AMP-dependent transcriptional regulator
MVETGAKLSEGVDGVALLDQAGAIAAFSTHQRRQIIFRQGTRAETVYYLQRGKVNLTVVSKQGKEAIIGTLLPGSFLGEECLIGESVYAATATARVDCSVLSLMKAQLLASLRKSPELAMFFTAYLLRRNTRIQADLVDQLFNSSEKRLARLLLLLAQSSQDESPASASTPYVALDVSQETIARMIGTTRSRVSFFMNKFRRLGFLEYKPGLRVYPSLLSTILRD